MLNCILLNVSSTKPVNRIRKHNLYCFTHSCISLSHNRCRMLAKHNFIEGFQNPLVGINVLTINQCTSKNCSLLVMIITRKCNNPFVVLVLFVSAIKYNYISKSLVLKVTDSISPKQVFKIIITCSREPGKKIRSFSPLRFK